MVWFVLTLVAAVATANPFCEVLLNREHQGEHELIMRAHGEYAGVYRYRVTDGAAHVTGIFMHPDHKGKRLSGAFIGHMLERHPEIKKVGALLVMDNLYATNLIWVKKPITQKQCIRAANNSPFAKSFARYGFKITKCRWEPSVHFLEVEASL